MVANDNPYFSTMNGQNGREQLNYNAPTLSGAAGPMGPQNRRRRAVQGFNQIAPSNSQYQGGHFADWGTGATGPAGPAGPQGPTAPISAATRDAQTRWLNALAQGNGAPAPSGPSGPAAPAAPVGPNYDALAQAALGRINPIYDQLGAFGDQINQQRNAASAYTNKSIADSAAARYAEMQGMANTGWQSDATRANSAYQLNALRNSGLAQDEYARRMDEMNQLDYTTNTNAIAQARAAQQAGVWANANAGKAASAAASSGGGGGGGGGGSTSGNGYTDAELSARIRLLNQGQSKEQSGLSWLNDNYGQTTAPEIAKVVKYLKKTKGAGVADAIRKYGGTKFDNKTGATVQKWPQIMNLLKKFAEQRNKYHKPVGYSPAQAAASLDAERG